MNKLQTMILGLTLTVLMIALLFLPLRIKETKEPLVAPPTAATLSLVRRVSPKQHHSNSQKRKNKSKISKTKRTGAS